MTQPRICPVCKGEGEYKGKACHGCGGKGFVWPPTVWITQPRRIEDDGDWWPGSRPYEPPRYVPPYYTVTCFGGSNAI